MNGRSALKRLRESTRPETGQIPVVDMCLAVAQTEALVLSTCPLEPKVAAITDSADLAEGSADPHW